MKLKQTLLLECLTLFKVLELRAELVALQKQADEKSALHEREVKRAKLICICMVFSLDEESQVNKYLYGFS